MEFRDYGIYGRPNQLMEGFLQWNETEEADQLRESGSSSDFATYLNDKATKRLMWGYTEATSNWRRYTRTYQVSDFKPINFVRLSEMQDLLPFNEGGEYKDSQISEIVGPSLTVGTYGRLFSLTRKAIINDDLNQLRDRPAAMGRAAARTVARSIVANLEANPNTYDGYALFEDTHHHNLLGSAALSEEKLAAAILALRTQTDPNGLRLSLTPQVLVIPPALELTARRILQSTTVPQPYGGAGTSGPDLTSIQHARGGTNVLQGVVDYIVEDYLTDANDWYLFASVQDAPVMAAGFLNGKETPDIFLKDPGMRNVLGGSDPYNMEFDEIVWKVRHDWGVGVFDWRGAVKATTT